MSIRTTSEQKQASLVESIRKAEGHPTRGRLARESVKAWGRTSTVTMLESCIQDATKWVGARRSFMEAARKGILREAWAESSFSELLRLGVENIIMRGWEIPDTIWDDVLMTVPSKGAYGVYGATYRTTMPGERPAGGKFKTVETIADEKLLRNKFFGAELPVEREAFDDDQTGELNTKPSELGENMQLLKEMWFAGMIQAKAATFGDVKVPAPVYKDPDGNAGVYSVARGNRFTTFQPLNLESFNIARQKLLTIKDPNGNIVGGLPDTLVVAPNLEKDANTIMNSTWTPSNIGTSATPTYPTDYNFIKGMAKVKVCVYLPDNFWVVGRAKKRSLIYQPRMPLYVNQEDPMAGKSFETYSYIFQTGERWAMGWLLGGSRHWFQGNDGTVAQPGQSTIV